MTAKRKGATTVRPVYFVAVDSDTVYRRRDGDPDGLPDELFTASGWQRVASSKSDLELALKVMRISEEDAKRYLAAR